MEFFPEFPLTMALELELPPTSYSKPSLCNILLHSRSMNANMYLLTNQRDAHECIIQLKNTACMFLMSTIQVSYSSRIDRGKYRVKEMPVEEGQKSVHLPKSHSCN